MIKPWLFVKSSVCCSQSFWRKSGPPKKTRMTMQSERLSPEATGSETRARYEQSADSLSDYMRLFSGALLDHNFNNPAGAVEKIQHMYDEYNAQMGGNFSHCSG